MKRTITALLIALLAVVAASAAMIGCTTASASDAPARGYEFRDISDYFAPRVPSGMVRIKQEMDARAAEAAQEAEQAAQEAQEVEQAYYADYSAPYGGNDYGNSFKFDGVAYIGDQEFNWYSQIARPGGGLDELNANGRHVDESTGFVVDGDGYIAVASPWGRDEVGTIVETPFGQGKVYDANEGDAYDIYTDF